MQNQVEFMKAAVWAAFERGDLTDSQATLDLLRIDRMARVDTHPDGVVSLDSRRRQRCWPDGHSRGHAA